MNHQSTMLQLFVGITLLFSPTFARNDGAPVAACETLAPDETAHNAGPQTGEGPYIVSVGDATTYTFGTPVTVTVSSMEEDTAMDNGQFKGVLCQARGADTEVTPQGTFELMSADDAKLKLITCTTEESSVTHKNANDVASVMFKWNPPAGDMGNITIRCAVVQVQAMYWTEVDSSDLMYMMPDAVEVMSTAGSDPMPTMETTTAAASSLVAGSFFSLLICMLLAKTV